MALHKKLSKKPRTDLNTDLSDYEMAALPNPTSGPFECEEGFLNIYDLDFFSKEKLSEVHDKFQLKMISKIGSESLKKIELGLKAYVASAKSDERNLLVLKKSINVWKPNLFSEFRKNLSEPDLQHLRSLDVEDLTHKEYATIQADELIPANHLKVYQRNATTFSVRFLKAYVQYCKTKKSLVTSLDLLSFFRGYNNKTYYNKGDIGPDIFSHYYSATDANKEIFFERKVFTSYTICLKTAELFMVAFGSRRRALVESSLTSIQGRIFSSFIVSASFYRKQFEFLALPSVEPLLIFKDQDNEDMSSFKLVSSTLPNKLVL